MRRLAFVALLVASAAATASPFGSLLAGERPATVGTGTLAPCPASPNCVSSRDADDEHRVAPIPFRGDPATAMKRVAEAAAGLPGARVATSRPDYLHVEAASRFWGFVDDLEVVPDASGVLHVRSAARLGRRDFGVNRARVEALRVAMTGG